MVRCAVECVVLDAVFGRHGAVAALRAGAVLGRRSLSCQARSLRS